MVKNKKIIIGYVRVSTEEQKRQGYSISEQINYIKKQFDVHYNFNDYELVIIDDAGHSGRSMKRPGIREIYKLVKQGNVIEVMFIKLDRLSRNVKESTIFVDFLKSQQVNIVSIIERLDLTTASGEFAFNITSSVAQYESRQISERTKLGLDGKTKKGLYPYGKLPLGISKDKDGNLYHNDNIIVVKELYELYIVQGFSSYEVNKIIKHKYPEIEIDFSDGYITRLLSKKLYQGYFQRETLEKELLRVDVIDPIFTLDEISRLKRIRVLNMTMQKHTYKFRNKIFFEDNTKMNHCVQKKRLSSGTIAEYTYYYSKKHSIYVNENLIDEAIEKFIIKNKHLFEYKKQKHLNKIENMFVDNEISHNEYKRLREKIQNTNNYIYIKRIVISSDKRILVEGV